MEREREIDLRPIIQAVVRGWRILALGMLIVLVAAAAWIFYAPVRYQAAAQVLIAGARSQTQFEARVEDAEFESLQTLSDPLPEQAMLAAGMTRLARSGDVLSRTIQLMGDDLPPNLRELNVLAEYLSTFDDARSNMLSLQVAYPDGALAVKIANAWAAAFVEHGNRVYSASGSRSVLTALQGQNDRARQQYEQKEQALADFIASDTSEVLEQRIGEYHTAIGSLRLARTNVLSATASADALYATKLISSYTSLRWSAYTAVISESNRYDLQQLSDAYATLRRLEMLRPEAQALRDHLAAGGDPQSAALALQLLKMQAFSAGGEPPAGLQLQVPAAPTTSVADVETVIATIDERLRATQTRIADINERLRTRSAAVPEFVPPNGDEQVPGYAAILGENLLQRAVGASVLTDTVGAALAPDDAIVGLQRQVQQMEADLQRLRAQRFVLEQERDSARAAYASLGLKIANLESTDVVGEQVVRLASNAAEASKLQNNSRYLQAALALLATLLGITLFIVLRSLAPGWLRAAPKAVASADIAPTQSG